MRRTATRRGVTRLGAALLAGALALGGCATEPRPKPAVGPDILWGSDEQVSGTRSPRATPTARPSKWERESSPSTTTTTPGPGSGSGATCAAARTCRQPA